MPAFAANHIVNRATHAKYRRLRVRHIVAHIRLPLYHTKSRDLLAFANFGILGIENNQILLNTRNGAYTQTSFAY